MTHVEGKPDLVDLIKRVFAAQWAKYHGPLPGKVQSFSKSKQTADVRPIVQLYIDGEIEEAPILRDVPICFPSGGGSSITWHLQSGDYVDLLPQEADISGWLGSKSEYQSPESQRRFSLSDVVAVATLRPPSSPLSASCFATTPGIKLQGPQIIAVPTSGLVNLGADAPTSFVALASLVDAAITAMVGVFNGHKHTSTTPSGNPADTSGPVDTTMSPAVTGSTKVKAI